MSIESSLGQEETFGLSHPYPLVDILLTRIECLAVWVYEVIFGREINFIQPIGQVQ